MDLIGSWAYDLISIEDHIPEDDDFKESQATFVEVSRTTF